jgi:hypothetical protein
MTAIHDFIPASRADIEAELRVRAHKDKDFRQRLLADPHTTLQQHYPQWFPDGKIPEEFSIKIIEEDKQMLSIVLPQQQDDEFSEVNEESWENVVGAGGSQIIASMRRGMNRNGRFTEETNLCSITERSCHTNNCSSHLCN